MELLPRTSASGDVRTDARLKGGRYNAWVMPPGHGIGAFCGFFTTRSYQTEHKLLFLLDLIAYTTGLEMLQLGAFRELSNDDRPARRH